MAIDKAVDSVALNADLKRIADKIRAKGGTPGLYGSAAEMEAAVGAIPGPKPEQSKTVTITSNGDYPITPDAGKVLSKAIAKVNVPAPTGVEKTVEITANGLQEFPADPGTLMSKLIANVNVSGGGEPKAKYGTFTPANDIHVESNTYGGGYELTHGLGVTPNAVVVWSDDFKLSGSISDEYLRELFMIFMNSGSDFRSMWSGGAVVRQYSGREETSYVYGSNSISTKYLNENIVRIGLSYRSFAFKAGVKYKWRVSG